MIQCILTIIGSEGSGGRLKKAGEETEKNPFRCPGRKVELAEFKPSIEMVSRNEVQKVVEEFRQFLLKNLENPEDVLDIR